MKRTLLLWLLIAGEIFGIFYVYLGFRKLKGIRNFEKVKFSRENPISKSSCQKLIFEGLFIMSLGILFYLVWFIW